MTSKKKDASVLLSTCPSETAPQLARFLVENRLVACVNIVPHVSSVYWWEGKVEVESESLLVAKAASSDVGRVTEELQRMHPYETPAIVALPITGGYAPYLEWIQETASLDP